MNILAKPQLGNSILLDELIDIMENLGIPDDGGSPGGESPQQNDDDVQDTPEQPQK